MKIVEVKWLDSIGDGAWISYTSHEGLDNEIHTIGFLVSENDDSITISAHLSGLNTCDNPMRIPRISIIEYYEIKFKK